MKQLSILWTVGLTLLLSGGCGWQQNPAEYSGNETLLTYAGTYSDQMPEAVQTPQWTAPTSAGSESGIITVDEAKAKALVHAGLIGVQVTFVKSELEYENGRQVYDIEFYTQDNKEYDYEIDAATGEVIGFSYDSTYVPAGANGTGNNTVGAAVSPAASDGSILSEAKAKELALALVPGAAAQDIRKFKLEYDNGRAEYEGKIIFGGAEYEFEMDASTGKVTSFDYDAEYTLLSGLFTGGSAITIEQAKELALQWVSGATAKDIHTAKTDYGNGRTEYEIEILFGGAEYEFEIDAATGKLIGCSYDAVYVAAPTAVIVPTAPADSSAITIEQAKELALAMVPGATAQHIRKCKTDHGHGCTEYEVKILYGGVEYEMEFNAATGELIGYSCDTEYDALIAASAGTGATITAEQAKNLVLARIPGATAQDIMEFEEDCDDGYMEYEGKILYGGVEYEFEIDCHGVFHCWEMEHVGYSHHSEHHSSHHTAGTILSAAQAKELALAQVPGATLKDIREFKTDYDDGKIEYEGKIVYNSMEYEFEIDGYSGAFREWEVEPVGHH